MPVRRAEAYTIVFPLIDPSNRPVRKTGVTFAAGDSKISKDGGAFANTTNSPAEIGSSGRYKLDLTATEMDASWLAVYVEKSGVDPMDDRLATSGDASASVVADGSNTATTFKTDRAETATDYWKDALVRFTSGNLKGQVRKVTAYDGSTKFVTLSSAFSSAPSAADRFLLVSD